jgi:hypothetical protein
MTEAGTRTGASAVVAGVCESFVQASHGVAVGDGRTAIIVDWRGEAGRLGGWPEAEEGLHLVFALSCVSWCGCCYVCWRGGASYLLGEEGDVLRPGGGGKIVVGEERGRRVGEAQEVMERAHVIDAGERGERGRKGRRLFFITLEGGGGDGF